MSYGKNNKSAWWTSFGVETSNLGLTIFFCAGKYICHNACFFVVVFFFNNSNACFSLTFASLDIFNCWMTSQKSFGTVLYLFHVLFFSAWKININKYKKKEIKMSTPANEIQEITTAQFDELLKEQTPEYNKWSDLEENKIYTVTNTKMVDTQYGKSMILTLLNNGDVWAPEHLKYKICNGDTYANPPFYVRPLGLKPCKNNKKKINKKINK